MNTKLLKQSINYTETAATPTCRNTGVGYPAAAFSFIRQYRLRLAALER